MKPSVFDTYRKIYGKTAIELPSGKLLSEVLHTDLRAAVEAGDEYLEIQKELEARALQAQVLERATRTAKNAIHAAQKQIEDTWLQQRLTGERTQKSLRQKDAEISELRQRLALITELLEKALDLKTRPASKLFLEYPSE